MNPFVLLVLLWVSSYSVVRSTLIQFFLNAPFNGSLAVVATNTMLTTTGGQRLREIPADAPSAQFVACVPFLG